MFVAIIFNKWISSSGKGFIDNQESFWLICHIKKHIYHNIHQHYIEICVHQCVYSHHSIITWLLHMSYTSKLHIWCSETQQDWHYSNVIMSAMASQITSLMVVFSTVYPGADQIKHQSFAPLAFVRGIHRWPVNSAHERPVTWKTLPFDDVIIFSVMNVSPGHSWVIIIWLTPNTFIYK